MFQKKGQLGHGLTRIKKKVCFAFGEKGHIASRHLCISGRDLYGYNLRFRFDVNPENPEPLNLEPLNGYNLPNQPFNFAASPPSVWRIN